MIFKQPWHFDKFRVDEDGEYVKCIGHFQGDWTQDIINAREIGVNCQPYNEQEYGHASNEKVKGIKKRTQRTLMVNLKQLCSK